MSEEIECVTEKKPRNEPVNHRLISLHSLLSFVPKKTIPERIQKIMVKIHSWSQKSKISKGFTSSGSDSLVCTE